eukprot:146419-Prorocentrum_lima.AAC.1
MLSAGEDEEACLVHQLDDERELAIQGRQQREENQRSLPSNEMNTRTLVEERQVMSPNSAGVGSSV